MYNVFNLHTHLHTVSTDYSLSGDDLLSYSIEEEEYTEHTDDDVFDEPVKHYTFTPFQHRPYITSESRVCTVID